MAETMTFEEIINELKNKRYRPVYLLMGDEPYFIDAITEYIAVHALQESEKPFNQVVMYGKDKTVMDVLDAAKRYPMGAQHQVVIVKEAQELTDPEDRRTKGKLDKLQYYAEKPLKSTILVLNYKYKTLDKSSKEYKQMKQMEKTAVVLESKKLYENQIPSWINGYLSERGYSIALNASKLLTDYLGNDLGKVVNELNKLMIVLSSGKERKITSEHIEQNVGISKDYNVFELQKALGEKDVLKANRIVLHFAANSGDNSLIMVINQIFSYFIKVLTYHYLSDKSQAAAVLRVNPYFVKDYEAAARKYSAARVVQIISILREYDLKSKGAGNASSSDGDLMREMVYKIMHAA
ncbi:MAG: DNA polymerase III subunit delta [Bacteroidales bacterium]|jgi:DNA polymerase-3 subunit delta|nr:DNA polymerase III subunit delta [Bacteroidales bacterium]